MSADCSDHTERGSFTVMNDKGLHTRPATELAKCAQSFKSRVSLRHQGVDVNAKSIFEILMLAASQGDCVEVEAVGVDAVDVVKAVVRLAGDNFNIHY